MEGLAKGYTGVKGKKGADKVADLVGTLLMSRTYAHMAHLKTTSYAKHVALDEFYTCIVGLADRLAEVAQGKFGRLDIPVVNVTGNVDKPIDVLEMHMEDIMILGMSCGSGAMKTVLDDIEALYLTTLYKLRELN